MQELGPADLVAMFQAIRNAIEADKERLSRLDGAIGDADHGITMAMGFDAVMQALGKLEASATDPTTILNTAAKSFLASVGASAGPLYATAFMRAAAAVKGRQRLGREAVVGVLTAMAGGIVERGKAEPGQKTMVDAWAPAAEAARHALDAGADLATCLDRAAEAAASGAEATKALVATKGRAERLGERSRGHMDPGAASAATMLRAMARFAGGAPA